MKGKVKKLPLLLALVMMFQTAVFAAGPKDIDQNYWARAQVDFLIEKDIMPLYDDETFKPLSPVNYLETLMVIYRVALELDGVNEKEIQALASIKAPEFQAMGIPKTLKPYGETAPAIVYALENDIINMNELKTFVSDGELTLANKSTVSVYIAKAMNVFKQEEIENGFAIFSYQDTHLIPQSARPYIFFLINEGIISEKGNDQGNFQPNSIITRQILAVYAKGYYDRLEIFLAEQENKPAEKEKPVEKDVDDSKKEEVKEEAEKPVEESRNYEGKIKAIDLKAHVVSVELANGSVRTFKAQEGHIYYQDQQVGFESMYVGQSVSVNINPFGEAVMTLKEVQVLDQGKFSTPGVWMAGEQRFRLIGIQTDNQLVYRRFTDHTKVYINGKPGKLEDINRGDQVFAYHDGDPLTREVYRLYAYSTRHEMEGMLLSDYERGKTKTVRLLSEEGYVHDFPIRNNVVLSRMSNVKDIQHYVKVTLQSGEVTRMESQGTLEWIFGTVKGIRIQEHPEIVLQVASDNRTVKVPHHVKVIGEKEDDLLTLYDLRLGQTVTLKMDRYGVAFIKMGQPNVRIEDREVYTITQVIPRLNLIIAVDKDNVERTILFHEDSAQDVSSFRPGLKIHIEGHWLPGNVIEARKIEIVR